MKVMHATEKGWPESRFVSSTRSDPVITKSLHKHEHEATTRPAREARAVFCVVTGMLSRIEEH